MDPPTSSSTRLDPPFGPPFIIHPTSSHTHTAILLHGRGSTGEEFAKDFTSSHLTSGRSLPEKLSGWRWVFPSSQVIWSPTFQENMPAWFEAYSLTDIGARQDLQVKGIRASVEHIRKIMHEEIVRLDGRAERVVLGGISQGAAVGLWTLLSIGGERVNGIGAFFGASTWLPFAADIEQVLDSATKSANSEDAAPVDQGSNDFVMSTVLGLFRRVSHQQRHHFPPMLLGHGVDDAYVDVELGRQATRIFRKLGASVEWKEYSGAEEEGHWFKVPDQMDDIHAFLRKNMLDDPDESTK